MVYYRKYRPQTLSELFGQELVVQTLSKALENKQLAHAYLFTGPRGVGKTSTARILAKMVNCEKGGCNECETCQSINDGSNMDLIEIDAASNRGIDDIRDLRDRIKLAPTSLKKKVYIIDEVHMLTTEAFNALLKTLEEPPEHVLFILATTEVQKIPQTILSRVQRLDFKMADKDALKLALKRVVEGEKLQIDEEALNLLSKRSEGSFRDGVKFLDQISSIDKKITLEMVEGMIEGGKFEAVLELVESLSKKDPKLSLEALSKITAGGINSKEFVLATMDILRSLLLLKHGQDSLVKEMGEEKYAVLKKVSESFESEDLLNALDSFQKALENMKIGGHPTLPLEIAVIESASVKDQVEVRETIVVKSVPVVVPAVSKNSEEPQESTRDDVDVKVDAPSTGSDLSVLKDKWNYILEMVKPYNFSLEAMLKSVTIGDCSDGELVLKVPYSFHQRILETPRNRDLLESVLSDVLGKQIRVSCELDAKPAKVEELANIELAADDEVIKIAAEIFNS